MDELFLKLVNMSISAGWLALAVMVLRLFLRKAPKWLWPALWGCVGLRLVLPVSIESALSLIPSAETFSPEIVYQPNPTIHSGVGVVDSVVNPIVGTAFAPAPGLHSVNPLQVWVAVFALVWAVGVCALLAWAAVSYFRLRRRVGTAVRLRQNIYQSEGAQTPFVLGLFRPRIYLPFSLSEEDAELVIAHEQAHIARKDHWIKPVGYLLLCIYWFNPILWAAYVLLCRDIELACDERVVQTLTADRRADYSQALLFCSVNRRTIAACPLAFGEVGVKERVKHVLNYKKPAFWLAGAAVVCCIAVAVCFLTDPPAPHADGEGTVLGGTPAPSGTNPEDRDPAPPVSAPVSPVPSGDPAETSPAQEPSKDVPLTQESAEVAIASVLGSLRVKEDQIVTFSLPEVIPVSEDGKTKLTISLSATYSSEPGTFSVVSFLDWETDWLAGQIYGTDVTDPERGELQEIMLRAAYMTDLGDGSYREYAADYVELNAPFFDVPVAAVSLTELFQEGRDLTVLCLLRDGSQFSLSLTLPEGVTAQVGTQPTDPGWAAPQVNLMDQAQQQAGTLTLYPLAAAEGTGLETVDTGADELPMAVFAAVALSNHADYEDYTVVRHGRSWASATARYVWQDLSAPGYEGAAAGIPLQGVDCVLAYDWSAAPCFAELILGDGVFSPETLRSVAESIVIR